MPKSEFQNAPDLLNALKKEIRAGNTQSSKEIIRMLGNTDDYDVFQIILDASSSGDLEVLEWLFEYAVRSAEYYDEHTYNKLVEHAADRFFGKLNSARDTAIQNGNIKKLEQLTDIFKTGNDKLQQDERYILHDFHSFHGAIINAGNNGHYKMLEYLISLEGYGKINRIYMDQLMYYGTGNAGFMETYMNLSEKNNDLFSIDYRHGKDKRTAIMIAAGAGELDTVKVFETKGADLSLLDDNGNTLLSYALSGGDRETIKYVLSLCDEESVADELLRHGKDHYPLSLIPFEKWMMGS